jgi:hypothetical protein
VAVPSVKANKSGWGSIAVLQGINIGGQMGPITGNTLPLQALVARSDSQGTPSSPSIVLYGPTYWRFRWTIRVGTQTLRVSCLQAGNESPRPTMVIKANTDVGLNADVSGSAPSSTGWVVIGPLSVTANATGAVFVEFHNNYIGGYDFCYFDLLIAT